MMRIALCDDDNFFSQKLSGLLEDYFSKRKTKISIDCFVNVDNFLKSPLEQYEIVFLDVELGSDSGVEAARTLRRRNTDAVLVFISSYIKYAPKGYEVNAFRYLLKDTYEAELPFCLDAAQKQLLANGRAFTLKTTDGKVISMRFSDVLYAESRNHNVWIHTKTDRYCTYDTLSNVIAKISSEDFLQIQRSYYVNMRNVTGIKGCDVFFANGQWITGSRKYKNAMMQSFLSIQGEC